MGHGQGEDVLLPRSGDVLHVSREASVQFAEPLLFRVIRVHDWPTYDGWIWLDGYELNKAGDAVERVMELVLRRRGLRRPRERRRGRAARRSAAPGGGGRGRRAPAQAAGGRGGRWAPSAS